MDSINTLSLYFSHQRLLRTTPAIFSFICLLVNLSHLKNEVSLLLPILQVLQQKEKGHYLAFAPCCMDTCTEADAYFLSL